MAEQHQTLALILGLVRSGTAVTRPELMRQAGLSRGVVNQRVADAIRVGLLNESEEGISTGGRPSPTLRFRGDAGVILTAVFSASHIDVAITNLDGLVASTLSREWDFAAGPEPTLAVLDEAARELLPAGSDLWAVAAGFPVPVDFIAGVPICEATFPRWDGVRVRQRLEEQFGAPAYIDTAVNVKTLGIWSRTRREAGDDLLYIEADTGLGAGIVSHGALLRGAHGAAGEFGHVALFDESSIRCRCGNFGCLEALAGGWAVERDGYAAALTRDSNFLQERIARSGTVSIADVVDGARRDDRVSLDLIRRAGTLIGAQLASLVSVLNPATVFVGGIMANAGGPLLDPITDIVHRRVLPVATSDLVIRTVDLDGEEGAAGAAALASGELLTPWALAHWFDAGSPRGMRAGAPDFARPALNRSGEVVRRATDSRF